MPIYEYRCSACGFEKDALQKMSDPPLVDCPKCGHPTLVKQVSAAGFQLKGTGWYATDFKSSKPAAGKGEAKGEGAGDSGADGGDKKPAETKSDTKSADTKSADKAGSTEPAKPATPPAPGG